MGREGESVKHYQTGTGLRSERYEAQTRETGTQRQEWILLGHLGKNNVSLMNHNPAINHLLIALSRRQENIACHMKSLVYKKRSGRKKGNPPCKMDASFNEEYQEFNFCLTENAPNGRSYIEYGKRATEIAANSSILSK